MLINQEERTSRATRSKARDRVRKHMILLNRMQEKKESWTDIRNTPRKKYEKTASLTVEAAMVLPVFLFCIMVFLYFLQIFILQEHIQDALTKTGLLLAKSAYVYGDFVDEENMASMDFSLFGTEYELDLSEAAEVMAGELLVKSLLRKELDIPQINDSWIQGGYGGISFYSSKILEDDCIDIVARYHIHFPIRFFALENLRLIQRVRLRGWTGHQVPARYTLVTEDAAEDMVYITATGTVYHRDRTCSHLNISIEEVIGLPENRRNKSGGKYYPCELCLKGQAASPGAGIGTYYITAEGDRYHNRRDCSGLKRTVKEVPLSTVSDRAPCKRCGKKQGSVK